MYFTKEQIKQINENLSGKKCPVCGGTHLECIPPVSIQFNGLADGAPGLPEGSKGKYYTGFDAICCNCTNCGFILSFFPSSMGIS